MSAFEFRAHVKIASRIVSYRITDFLYFQGDEYMIRKIPGLRPAELELVSFSCRFELPPAVYAGLPSRSDVNSYVTANVYYVTFRYPCT